ncbi:hypothetical protein [Segniliparus rotundus]|uniref:PPW family C-terminal domain-containing PPE protein n=1 Tax=Segniliparus rotundus TaxID=286802 RepID=UPI00059EBB8C
MAGAAPGSPSGLLSAGPGAGSPNAGALAQHEVNASGCTKLADGAFATGPTVPLLPQTWDKEPPAANKHAGRA